MSRSFTKPSEAKKGGSGAKQYNSERPESRGRSRSKSFELTKRSDSRSNSALRKTPKLTNESVEKEISNYFQKKYSESMVHERNL
jgi:hypothetical protein